MLEDVLKRIDQRLKAVNLKESAAALKAGLSDSAIRNMRRAVKDGKGKTQGASTKTLEKLAPVLRTTTAWLADESGPEVSDGSTQPQTPIDVPLIPWVSAGQLTQHEGVLNFDDFPTIAALDLAEGDWIAFRVDGNSMNKISPPDSIVLANRRDKRLVSNGCYIVADETGSVTYKRYRPNEDPPYQPASYDKVPPPQFEGAVTVIARVRRSYIDM